MTAKQIAYQKRNHQRKVNKLISKSFNAIPVILMLITSIVFINLFNFLSNFLK